MSGTNQKQFNLDNLLDIAKSDRNELLTSIFNDWDRQTLVEFAIISTQSITEERSNYRTLNTQYNTAQTRAQGLAFVKEIGESLSSTLDVNEILIRLLNRVSQELDVRNGSVMLVEKGSGDLVFQTSIGYPSMKPFRLPHGEGLAGEVVMTGKPIRVDNAQSDIRHFKKFDNRTGFLTETVLYAPLTGRDKVIGVIGVFNKRHGLFTDSDEILLNSVGRFAAIAIENACLHQDVKEERDRIVEIQQEVSTRLQRDLHDGPTQLVASLQMSIDFCRKALKKDPSLLEEELNSMYELAQKATHQMRTLLFELRPLVLEAKGLVPALQELLARHEGEGPRFHLRVCSDLPSRTVTRLSVRVERTIFAIVQESINNIIKHAKAHNVLVKLKQKNHRLNLSIIDDGVGFDVSDLKGSYETRGSYGMLNIKERADVTGGKLTVKSAIGAGTEIRVVNIPIPSQ